MIQLIQEDYGELRYEIWNGEPLLHATVQHWSPSLFKEMRELLEDIKVYFKEEGFTRMYVAGKSGNVKVQKFWGMFGFHKAIEEDGVVIYAQELTDGS